MDTTEKTVSLENSNGDAQIYQLTAFTKIIVNDKPATLDKILEGMNADIIIGSSSTTLSKIVLTGTAISLDKIVPVLFVGGNNKKYYNVSWGEVGKRKVKISHDRGESSVQIADLPLKYQKLLNYTPSSEPATENPVAKLSTTKPTSESHKHNFTTSTKPTPTLPPIDPDWEQYSADRKTKVLFHGKLADITTFKQIVGFIGEPGGVDQDGIHANGTLLELAEMIDHTPQSTNAMSLRPNLWKKTSKMVLLRDYKPAVEVNIIVRLFVAEVPATGGCPLYDVATEPTFEQWKKLRSISPIVSRTP